MIKYIEKHPVTSIIFISLLMLLPNLDTMVVTIMEARNFITAREMVTDGNWILTTMNGEPRYQKPPLPTWLTAIFGMIFGMKSLFALRLPAALMVAFSGVFMFLFSNKLFKNNILSLVNGLILITSFYIVGIINEAPWDIYTHGFMIAAIYCLYQFFEDENAVWKNALLAGFMVGLSLMSKGPVSFYALLLPFIISYGIVFKFKNFKSKFLPLIAFIIVFAFIGGWWFLYVRQIDPEAFTKIAEKETSNWGSYNVRPFYYYWSFFTQSGIWTILALIGLIYPYLIKRVSNKKLYKFSFFWTIIAVILLSIIPEKKSRYLVPVLFPLAINTGFYIEYLINNFKNLKSKKETIPVYFNFGLFAVIGIVFPIVGYILLKDKLEGLWFSFILTSIILFSIGILLFKFLKNKDIKKAFYTKIAFMVTIFCLGLPLTKAMHNNTNFNQISGLKSTIETKNDIKSYSVGELTPELLWYYDDKMPNIYIDNKLKLPKENKFGLLIEKHNIKLLKNLPEEYTSEFIKEYDINFFKKKRERLIREYYIITKNTTFE
ncbi:ArnT family glycosyltransferase [Urechidicola croceus]|uniref:Glycosyltransferase n=1 Tax=Urechidicola croceus TaxID=1850246 RepID=A0A1D8P5Y3_9FLAO|nr:phospholipid carrier-dependent glycosyltransferase [Urechidicola croceus]AOW19962.1 glycosyltransferase [Urechidicola croceus]